MAETLELSEWQSILLKNTSIYENNRYDALSQTIGSFGLADIKTDDDRVTNMSYRSYGMYRRDSLCDSSFVKINETYYSENHILDHFYETNTEDKYRYGGIVLSKQFATNGNEASLEDIFCEFAYDYLKALDMQLFSTENRVMYFDNDKNIQGAWTILPIGTSFTYKKINDVTNEAEWITEPIEYDGTYVPTTAELLRGQLYIVIKSGSLEPQKIYFNNNYMPTLFLNDDKFPNTTQITKTDDIYDGIHISSNDNTYVINNQQPVKLCDITKFERLACNILWDLLFVILNQEKLIEKINIAGIPPASEQTGNLGYTIIGAAWGVYEFEKTFSDGETEKETDRIFFKLNGEYYLMAFDDGTNSFNDYKSIPFYIKTAETGIITMDIYVSLLLQLRGYSLDVQEKEPEDVYDIDWYIYTEDKTPVYVPQLLIKE